jgi:hypothetical protein
MTGSMAGSFTVHLESAGKCSHEMTGNCETPKGAGAPNAKKKRQSVPGNLHRWSDHEAHLHPQANMTIMTIITNFILGW